VTVELDELPAPLDGEAQPEKTTRRVAASELTAAAAAAAAGVADAGRLEQLSAASLLHTLRTRAANDLFYTSVGSVLVAVNPCKPTAAAAAADAATEVLR
jgi:myosin heavy subunit